LKVYSDDPNFPYKTSRLKALYMKRVIDCLFAMWVFTVCFPKTWLEDCLSMVLLTITLAVGL
jgi:hypothetical protein